MHLGRRRVRGLAPPEQGVSPEGDKDVHEQKLSDRLRGAIVSLPHPSLFKTGDQILKVASITVNFNTNDIHMGKIEGAGQAGRRVARVAKRLRQRFELDQELGADDHLIDPEAQDQVGDGPFLELHEREHGVLGLDLTVMLFGCDLLGREEGLLGLLAELALCHVVPQYNLSAKL